MPDRSDVKFEALSYLKNSPYFNQKSKLTALQVEPTRESTDLSKIVEKIIHGKPLLCTEIPIQNSLLPFIKGIKREKAKFKQQVDITNKLQLDIKWLQDKYKDLKKTSNAMSSYHDNGVVQLERLLDNGPLFDNDLYKSLMHENSQLKKDNNMLKLTNKGQEELLSYLNKDRENLTNKISIFRSSFSQLESQFKKTKAAHQETLSRLKLCDNQNFSLPNSCKHAFTQTTIFSTTLKTSELVSQLEILKSKVEESAESSKCKDIELDALRSQNSLLRKELAETMQLIDQFQK
eukprot:NODE_239_length_11955_cov_0.931174.p5 type:complete len:291 gc:universal NODE_239_length_11955_cov_0.931174:6588-7460(+)